MVSVRKSLLVVALAALLIGSASADESTTRQALLAFPDKFPSLRDSWTGNDYCSGWTGVSCSGADVSIDLSGAGLQGFMPSFDDDINGSAIDIVAINLSNNNGITGNFQDSWAALKRLRTLDLSHTSLYGNIPSGWNSMIALESIVMTNTNACRSLPSWGSGMAALQTVDLSNNGLRGSLADSWASIPRLSSVKLTGNSFCGCLPDTWKSVALLQDAAIAANSRLGDANCERSNQCNSDSFRCDGSAATVTSALTAVVAAAVAAAVFVL